jgi:acyl-CoA thioesterase-1
LAKVGLPLVAALCLIALPHRPLAAEPLSILAFGDSLVAGFGLADRDGFAPQLERALAAEGVEAKVINAGVSGDTTAGGRARLDWSLAGWAAGAGRQLVILELGANDMLRGIEPVETRNNLDAMLSRLQASGATVLLAGMRAAPNLGPDYRAAFDAIFPELAEKHGVALYPFFLEGVAARPDLNQPDGLHPNAAGVAEIVRRILPHVVAALEADGRG